MKIAPGRIQDSGAIIDSTKINQISNKITILGDPGAILTTNIPAPVLTIQGSVNVEIRDLEIEGALGLASGQGDGIRLTPGGGDPPEGPTLNLAHVTIDSHMEHGIHATAGVLSVTQSTISGNDKGGVFVSESAAMVTITNSFIYGNGKDAANTNTAIGGLWLFPTIGGQLQFNTIVDNNASINQVAGGAICAKIGSPESRSIVTVNHNIIVRNTVDKTTSYNTNAQTNIGADDWGDSFVKGNPMDSDLKFQNPPVDYRLSQVSQNIKIIDIVTDRSACTHIGIDFGGDTRPQGSKCDLGADEFALGQNK